MAPTRSEEKGGRKGEQRAKRPEVVSGRPTRSAISLSLSADDGLALTVCAPLARVFI